MRKLIVVLCTWALALAGPAAAQTTVSSCGQTVTGPAVLGADLDCSAFAGPSAVGLGPSASLDLAGFTLHGPLAGEAVRCDGDCVVTSSVIGGRLLLSNAAEDITAVRADAGKFTVTLSEIVVDGFAVGVQSHRVNLLSVSVANITSNVILGLLNTNNTPNRVIVEASSISGSARFLVAGLLSRGSLRIRDSVFTNNTLHEDGLFDASSFRAAIRESLFTGNSSVGRLGTVKLTNTSILNCEGRGLSAGSKLRVLGGEFDNNGITSATDGFDYALSGGFLKVRDVSMRGNFSALNGDTVRVRDSVIEDSVLDGVRARLAFLTKTNVTGSGRYGVRARTTQTSFGSPGRPGKAVLKLSSVTASGVFGVMADGRPRSAPIEDPFCVVSAKVTLVASDVTGNATDSDCGTALACGDLAACDASLVTSAMECDTSYQLLSGIPGADLGVCALD